MPPGRRYREADFTPFKMLEVGGRRAVPGENTLQRGGTMTTSGPPRIPRFYQQCLLEKHVSDVNSPSSGNQNLAI